MTQTRTIACRVLFIIALMHALHRDVKAATLYVAPSGSNSPPYATWSSAASNIQHAIDAAVDGDTILVSNGTYVLSTQIVVTNGIYLSSVNGPALTVVDGNRSNRCILISHGNAVIAGFTITRGAAGGSFGGGGVYIAGAGTVSNCAISDNAAGFGGGVVCDQGGVVADSMISDNGASSLTGGGGFYLIQGGIIQESIIYSNRASYGAGGVIEYGGDLVGCVVSANIASVTCGGVYIDQKGSISASSIQNNQGIYQGGGVQLWFGGSVVDSIVANNEAGSVNANGGGGVNIFQGGYVARTLIQGNVSRFGFGGGISCYYGGTVETCRVVNNTAETGGGISCQAGEGVYEGSPPIIRNCAVISNTALYGGGLYCSVSNSVANCTIAYNVATTNILVNATTTNAGGGVLCVRSNVFMNSIVYYNTPDNITNVADNTLSHCCVLPGVSGSGNIADSPELGLSGGIAYALRATSPCIDAGTNLQWHIGALDVDGEDRLFGAKVDIGADEAVVRGSWITLSTNGPVLTWYAPEDARCQLLISTNLLSPDWQLTGTETTASVSRTLIHAVSTNVTPAFFKLAWER